MTAAPPFVHPAADPSPEVAERVRSRVETTARRRRARRRAVVAVVPVVAVVALLALAVVATGEDEDGGVVIATEPEPTSTTAPPFDQLSIEPNTHWNMPTLSADGRTLEISVSESCGGGEIVHDVVETPDSVIVGVESAEEEPLGPGEACGLAVRIETITVTLAEPLGDRPLYDGTDPEPRDDVMRKADLVDATYLPEGFAPVEEETYMDSPDEPWQQNFRAPGAGWYFAVNQVPTIHAAEFYGDDEGTPTTIAGRPAELITGEFNGFMETIRFELGDLTVSVWVEGPDPASHRDELVRIAEGIRLPEG